MWRTNHSFSLYKPHIHCHYSIKTLFKLFHRECSVQIEFDVTQACLNVVIWHIWQRILERRKGQTIQKSTTQVFSLILFLSHHSSDSLQKVHDAFVWFSLFSADSLEPCVFSWFPSDLSGSHVPVVLDERIWWEQLINVELKIQSHLQLTLHRPWITDRRLFCHHITDIKQHIHLFFHLSIQPLLIRFAVISDSSPIQTT